MTAQGWQTWDVNQLSGRRIDSVGSGRYPHQGYKEIQLRLDDGSTVKLTSCECCGGIDVERQESGGVVGLLHKEITQLSVTVNRLESELREERERVERLKRVLNPPESGVAMGPLDIEPLTDPPSPGGPPPFLAPGVPVRPAGVPRDFKWDGARWVGPLSGWWRGQT